MCAATGDAVMSVVFAANPLWAKLAKDDSPSCKRTTQKNIISQFDPFPSLFFLFI